MKDDVFTLPDGNALPYTLIYRGRRHFSTRDNIRLHQEVKKKQYRPTLEGISSRGSLKVIFADFDVLPEGYTSFEQLYVDVKKDYSSQGIPLKTSSKKVKIAFVVDFGFSHNPNKTQILFALSKLISHELFKYIDKNINALIRHFILPENIQPLKNGLLNSPVHIIKDSQSKDLSCNNLEDTETCGLLSLSDSNQKTLLFLQYTEELKSFPRLQKIISEMTMNGLVRILVLIRGLIEPHGFDLPTTKLAEQLNCHPDTVSRRLKELIRLRLLKCINFNYQAPIGKNIGTSKARTYRAKGELKRCIKSLTKNIHSYSLPKTIDDGKWEETLWKCAVKFLNKPNEFQIWARSLPGADLKDRPRKISRIFNKLNTKQTEKEK